MKTLTEKELIVMKSFIGSSFSCSGAFHEDNMSWNNDKDIAEDTGLSRQQVAGLFGQLEAKGLIGDSGESARGDRCNDYYAIPEACDEYPELVEFIKACQ